MALALGQSSRWPLVLASNRDEFHDRPTLPLSHWTTPDGTELVSGRDLRAGGTWLGATPGGRVALLTNVREGTASPGSGPRSRGELPLRWLGGAQSSENFLASISAQDYAGCNLVVGDSRTGEWTWASNRGGASLEARSEASLGRVNGWHFKTLKPGVYGLSNALLDAPWPKTQALKTAMTNALIHAEKSTSAQPEASKSPDTALAELQERLWSALTDKQRAEPHDLPRTGIDAELEHGLSSAWVDLPERGYGTRCSSLLWLEAAPSGPSHLNFTEKTWSSGNALPSSSALRWPLAGP